MNDVSGVQRVQALALTQIPQHGHSILASRGAEGAVGRDGDGVDVSLMTDQVIAEFAVGEVPDLDEFIPSGRDDDGVGGDWGESHARHPFSVSFGL